MAGVSLNFVMLDISNIYSQLQGSDDEDEDTSDNEAEDKATDASDNEAEAESEDEATDASDDEAKDEAMGSSDDEANDEARDTDASDDEAEDKARGTVASDDEARDAVSSDDEAEDEARDASDDEAESEVADASDDEAEDVAMDASDDEAAVSSDDEAEDEARDASNDEAESEAADASDDEAKDKARDAGDDEAESEAVDARNSGNNEAKEKDLEANNAPHGLGPPRLRKQWCKPVAVPVKELQITASAKHKHRSLTPLTDIDTPKKKLRHTEVCLLISVTRWMIHIDFVQSRQVPRFHALSVPMRDVRRMSLPTHLMYFLICFVNWIAQCQDRMARLAVSPSNSKWTSVWPSIGSARGPRRFMP